MTAATPKRFVLLVTGAGVPLTVFDTDRDEFPKIATYDRDRVFTLDYQGNLGALEGFPVDVEGAVYVETDPWRISGKTIDKPSTRKRRRRSATILAFPGKLSGGAA